MLAEMIFRTTLYSGRPLSSRLIAWTTCDDSEGGGGGGGSDRTNAEAMQMINIWIQGNARPRPLSLYGPAII
ncbi:hypothetical protein DERF_004235 [Dermatophagoides farinae]|uniref:Uncharacterized protein n=1 Tax=Dermatophagoides farinae TaxID=6954 RepID=A0A922I201_DERFA|nr:hypothetical protein DERF_004235 [Dermatophagoides farinae]